MAIASGVAKQVRIKAESTWGQTPSPLTGAQILRRTSSNLDLRKATYQSGEIRTDYQVSDMRHGVRTVDGAINGELSPGTYQQFMAAALRKAFVVGGTTTEIDITAQAAAPQFATAAGDFIADGHKVGHVVQFAGFTAGGAANNSKNFLITALTTSSMTGVFLNGDAVAAKAAGDSVTIAMEGKQTYVPQTGHTDTSFAVEHWYSDISQSELFLGCKINSMDVQLPATGMATVAFNLVGKDMVPGVAAVYTSPTAETGTGVLAAVNGAVYANGAAIALITGLNFTVNGNMTHEPVVGSNTIPDLFEGRVLVNGQFTAFFENATFRNYFDDETEVSLTAVFTTGNEADAAFLGFTLPRIKCGGAGKDDGEKGIVQTIPFTALLNVNGGAAVASEYTTIVIQDSTVV